MPLNLNNTEVTGVDLNNTEVSEVQLNGQTVFTAGPDVADLTFASQNWNQIISGPSINFTANSQQISGNGGAGGKVPPHLISAETYNLGQDYDVEFDMSVSDTSARCDWAFSPVIDPSDNSMPWGCGGITDFNTGYGRPRFYVNDSSLGNGPNTPSNSFRFKIQVRPNGNDVDVTYLHDNDVKFTETQPYSNISTHLGWGIESFDSLNQTISNLSVVIN